MVELLKLEIEGFGKFEKMKVINFEKGINFINGLNESGKSTILEAILASLFKYTNPKIEPYLCWTNKDVCRLALTYKTDNNETFKIISDYKNTKKRLEKIMNGNSAEISSTNSTIQQYIKEHFGFDEQKVFENTTFIRQSQMAILGDGPTKNKIRDMIEEVFVGTAEASATKALKKIKKISKDSKRETGPLLDDLDELREEFEKAEENKNRLKGDSEKHEDISKDLSAKSDELNKLKENKKLFDEKEALLKDDKNIDENINQVDEMAETLEGEREEPMPNEPNKTMPLILIIFGVLLCFIESGAIIGIPLIIYGIYKLLKKGKIIQKPRSNVTDKISKYKNQKRDLINKKAVVESKLEKYHLVKFTIDDFRDLNKLEDEVEQLKTKNIELKTSISTTKEFVKSPEEIKEEINSIEVKIKELNESVEEHELAYNFLEMAETEVQHKFTPAIEKNTKPILKEVTDNKYIDLKINEEDLNISIKAPEINEYVPVDILSQGAKDQVYFSIRTIMADLLSGNINIPLIFDDPFHNFDDLRLKRTIDAVKMVSQNKQIILISHKQYHKDFKDFADNIIEV